MSTTLTISAPATCWACTAALGESPLVCVACGKVQPSSSFDYFQVFALPRKLEIDIAALEREFHRLSRRLHPDRFARATPQEQQWSLAATALLNDAYRTLRDPIQRIEYLLKLEGLEIGAEHAGANKRAERQPPVDLLEEVFELNMQLEEMRLTQKMGESDPALQRDLAAARTRFQTLLDEVDRDLATEGRAWDEGSQTSRTQSAKAMAALLDRRRYLRNLVRDVNEVLANAQLAPNPENHA